MEMVFFFFQCSMHHQKCALGLSLAVIFKKYEDYKKRKDKSVTNLSDVILERVTEREQSAAPESRRAHSN